MAAEKELDALLKRYAQSIEGAMNVSAEACLQGCMEIDNCTVSVDGGVVVLPRTPL